MFKNFENKFDLGLLIIRVGIGILFIFHGWPKITGGPQTWEWLSNALTSYGIDLPGFAGLIPAIAEFGGGILLVLGLFTRTATFFLFGTMFVASLMHLGVGDPFGKISHPLKALAVFAGLFFTGPGKYSLDAKLFKK